MGYAFGGQKNKKVMKHLGYLWLRPSKMSIRVRVNLTWINNSQSKIIHRYLVSFIFFSQSIYYILTLNFKGSLLFREHKIRVAPYVIQSMIDPPLPMLFGTAVDFRNVQNSSIVECDSKILDLCFHKITWFKALYKIKVKRRFFGWKVLSN